MQNDLIIIVGYAGAYATKEIIKEKREEILSRFSFSYIKKLENRIVVNEDECCDKLCSSKEDDNNNLYKFVLQKVSSYKNKITVTECGKGGVLAGLWNFLAEVECGAEFSQKDIPILQGTIEICEMYKLNPYRLFSKNVCILNLCNEDAKKFLSECNKKNIPAAIIGHLTNEKQRIRIDNEEHSFLTKEQTDEIDKIIPRYTRIHK